MPKRSKKSKSKRVTLKQKHKVIRKVKEHHKKKAKDAKKLGHNRRPRAEKDPGIPNDWPFKEQELKALEARRARALEEIEQKKAARKERAKKRKLGLVDDEDTKIEEGYGEEKSGDDSARVVNVRDNSERAFYKELVKVIELSDVILEVLDARDPLGTRCTDMERMVMQAGPNKHLVLLLNKIDLVPREAAEKWLKYLREEFPAVAFKCSTQEQRSNLGWKSSKASKPSNILQTSDCLGADTLIKLLKNYSRSHELKKSITVGIIGLPNVGKSSLINSLKRAHVVNVGATPGLTRSLQEVHLDKNVKLLDCPGVVMLKSSANDASIALRNCKRIEKLEDPVSPVKEILKLCTPQMLVTLYKIPSFEALDDFLYKVATVRGKLKKGGLVDTEAAARIVLHDWNEGKIPFYTMPPKRDQGEHAESKIVNELAKEFNIDEVYSGESSFIGSLKTVNEFNPVEIPSNAPLNFDETMIEDESKTQTKEEEAGPEGDDESMGAEEEEETGKSKSETSKQNKKLYSAESMLNTKKQKAEKNMRKKAKKAAGGGEDSMDGDYDFKVDYAKNKATDMDEGEGFQIEAKVPMAELVDLTEVLECPKATLVSGYDPDTVYDPCLCSGASSDVQECSTSEEALDYDMSFCIGDEEVRCVRYKIASLSRPFKAMLYGGFNEMKRGTINFTHNGISVEGMRAAEIFSRTNRLDNFPPHVVLELLKLANRFCCDEMKSSCDEHLAHLVGTLDEAMLLIEYGLEESAYLLVAACLQVFLRELPSSMHNPNVIKIFCSVEGRGRLASLGHASFKLYFFLSQIAMEDDMKSNTTVMILERLVECAVESWEKQLACHQLGVVMLERKEYKDAQRWFNTAVEAGHLYSLVGVARSKFKRDHRYSAYKIINSLISDHVPTGWMHQERSLYCSGKEKLLDLDTATELDPTLTFPYKFRAVALVEENQFGAAISELNKILGFKASPDCLEMRAWISIGKEDYEGALKDIRALLTLEPNFMMFNGKIHADHMVELLRPLAQQRSQADCWMQLFDHWSTVDDIGSLAVVHDMLANDPGNSLLRFRQSLLLLRLNCQKAAMRCLRLARNHSKLKHERLVYEGWILYDTGHREEALAKAEESISTQRSFEAFFLKAYALADSTLDPKSAEYVIQLLGEALRCPSDALRKGQALNNLGSVYVDCEKLDLAGDCYTNALNIKHTRAHQGLARVYHLKNQRKAAYDEMTKLIEKAQNNASAYEKRSEYCDREMAQSDLSLATQLDPLRTYPYRYRAAVLMDDHKENEAIEELSRAISFKPDLQLLHLRAAFYDSMGEGASAIKDCEAALCIDPGHTDTLELYHKAREANTTDQK